MNKNLEKIFIPLEGIDSESPPRRTSSECVLEIDTDDSAREYNLESRIRYRSNSLVAEPFTCTYY
jgi:hypothetical protein